MKKHVPIVDHIRRGFLVQPEIYDQLSQSLQRQLVEDAIIGAHNNPLQIMLIEWIGKCVNTNAQ